MGTYPSAFSVTITPNQFSSAFQGFFVGTDRIGVCPSAKVVAVRLDSLKVTTTSCTGKPFWSVTKKETSQKFSWLDVEHPPNNKQKIIKVVETKTIKTFFIRYLYLIFI